MTATNRVTIPAEHRRDVERLWHYHQIGHDLHPVDVGIGLGSHDLGVAKVATDLYHRGMHPLLVFTGANAPTTIDRSPEAKPSTPKVSRMPCQPPGQRSTSPLPRNTAHPRRHQRPGPAPGDGADRDAAPHRGLPRTSQIRAGQACRRRSPVVYPVGARARPRPVMLDCP
jgi:hypothetical protein